MNNPAATVFEKKRVQTSRIAHRAAKLYSHTSYRNNIADNSVSIASLIPPPPNAIVRTPSNQDGLRTNVHGRGKVFFVKHNFTSPATTIATHDPSASSAQQTPVPPFVLTTGATTQGRQIDSRRESTPRGDAQNSSDDSPAGTSQQSPKQVQFDAQPPVKARRRGILLGGAAVPETDAPREKNDSFQPQARPKVQAASQGSAILKVFSVRDKRKVQHLDATLGKLNDWVHSVVNLSEGDFNEYAAKNDAYKTSRMWNELRKGGVLGAGGSKYYDKRIESMRKLGEVKLMRKEQPASDSHALTQTHRGAENIKVTEIILQQRQHAHDMQRVLFEKANEYLHRLRTERAKGAHSSAAGGTANAQHRSDLAQDYLKNLVRQRQSHNTDSDQVPTQSGAHMILRRGGVHSERSGRSSMSNFATGGGNRTAKTQSVHDEGESPGKFLLQDLFGFRSATPGSQQKKFLHRQRKQYSSDQNLVRSKLNRRATVGSSNKNGGDDDDDDEQEYSKDLRIGDNFVDNESFASISEQQYDNLYHESIRVQRDLFSSDVSRCMRGLVRLEACHGQIQQVLRRKKKKV